VVVGRQDTGDLEAQVRGSKHAWDIRLISADALIKLVTLKEETEEDTIAQIHEILVPFEYTKLDKIIEVAFTAAKDAGAVVQQEALPVSSEVEFAAESQKQDHTPPEVLAELRQRIVTAVGIRERAPLIRKSAALYWSPDRNIRIVCSISKRHARGAYWYAYHPKWDTFLGEGDKGFYVLGCVGRGEAFALPFDWIHSRLDALYTTERDSKMYWHIHLDEGQNGDILFRLFKLDQKISVLPFRVPLT
jgi:hypothetical protein